MKRKDTFRVEATVEGIGSLGVCRAQDGGDIESEETKVRPGGMGAEISLGGARSRNAMTLKFWNNEYVESLTPALERAAGSADAVISRVPLDADGNPNGRGRTFTGVLRNVKMPEYDADSNDASELELEFSLNESAT